MVVKGIFTAWGVDIGNKPWNPTSVRIPNVLVASYNEIHPIDSFNLPAYFE